MMSVTQAVQRLRSRLDFSGDLTVRQFDLNKAFYSVRVSPQLDGKTMPILIRVGDSYYESCCLVFGLACGPIGLNFAQEVTSRVSERIAEWLIGDKKLLQRSGWIVVMDDFLCVSPLSIADELQQISLTVWNLSGFNCTEDKRSVWDASKPSRWLGGHWSFDIARKRLILARPKCPDSIDVTTKRSCYKAAGGFVAITLGYWESLARAHCDCIRRLSGGWPSWDSVCGEKRSLREIEAHFQCAAACWKLCTLEDDDLLLFSELSCIDLYTDASSSGHGFFAEDPDSHKIACADVKSFTAKHREAWHINRKELVSTTHCIHKIDNLLECLPALRRVRLYCDSRVVTTQLNPWATAASKSVERRAIARLRNTIMEINYSWRRMGIDLQVYHISGQSNSKADRLSRVNEESKPVSIESVEEEWRYEVTPVGLVSSAEIRSNFLIEKLDSLLPHIIVPSFRRFVNFHEIFLSWLQVVRDKHTVGATVAGEAEIEATDDLRLKWLKFEQNRDPECRDAIEKLTQNPTAGDEVMASGFLYRLFLTPLRLLCRKVPVRKAASSKNEYVFQVVLPRGLLRELATLVHYQLAHAGFPEVMHLVSKCMWSPQIRRILKSVVGTCDYCLRIVNRPTDISEPSGPIAIPERPYQVIGADIYGPLTPDKVYILTICCRLTGWVQFSVLPDCKARTVSDEFERVVLWSWSSNTQECWSDQGAQFTRSPYFLSVCVMCGIKHRVLPPASPWAGGWWETHHRSLGKCLRAMALQTPLKSLSTMVAIAQNRLNASTTGGSRPSAYELIYGWQASVPVEGLLDVRDSARQRWEELRPKFIPADPIFQGAVASEAALRSEKRAYQLSVFREIWLDRREQSFRTVQKRLRESKKRRYDLNVEDRVLLTKRRKTKLSPIVQDEPFVVKRRVGNQTFALVPESDPGAPEVVAHLRNLRRYPGTSEEVESRMPGAADASAALSQPPSPNQDRVEEGSVESNSHSHVLKPRRAIHKGDRELKFLSKIEGSVSKYGRSRRGAKL